MGTTTREFISALTENHRVIVIGGLAVIAHGFNRPTKDADIWFEPMDSPEIWAVALEFTCARFPDLTLHTLPGWRRVSGLEIAVAADEVGMVRIMGLDCPLDVFRRPNEFEADSFEEVFSRCSRNSDGTWLPDPLDLAISKDQTNREKDIHDINFLEGIVRERWIRLLPKADLSEARSLFERFVDWRTCEAALANPDPEVRALATSLLRELADEGDPFSQALLEGREIL
jgi:hypothetical protein